MIGEVFWLEGALDSLPDDVPESPRPAFSPTTFTEEFQFPTAWIHADPARFAYKIQNEATRATGIDPRTGESGSLAGVTCWQPGADDALDLWLDPEDGRVYVIDGHNRLAKAVAFGIPSLEVRFIGAADARAAVASGATLNLGKARGTALDAAAYFRKAGIGNRQFYAEGSLVHYPFVEKGLALACLPDYWFQAVLNDPVDEEGMMRLAVEVAEADLTPAQAEAAYRELWFAVNTQGVDPAEVSTPFWRELLSLTRADKLPAPGDPEHSGMVHYEFTLWELADLYQELQG